MKRVYFVFSQLIEAASFIATGKWRRQSARPRRRHEERVWSADATVPRGPTTCATRLLALSLLLALPTLVQAQFLDTTNNGEITITGYSGAGGAVTIPGTIGGLPVTNIGLGAFSVSLIKAVYCQGNAPAADDWSVFYGENLATVYYLPGTTGWGSTFGGRPTALWTLPYPLILNTGPGFGAQTNGLGFTISWATNASVVVEASPNLAEPVWTPVATNSLTGGSSYFSDPQWRDYPARFYRLRSP
jgi:hypothetical protein